MADVSKRVPAAASAAHHAEPALHACFVAYAALRSELSRWLEQSTRCDGPGPNGGGEDEANYALAWFPHYLITGDPAIADWFRSLLAALAGWVAEQCHHGYEPEAEAHHGTEPFILFLPRYLALFPRDRAAQRLLLDAAEHVGNWSAEVPDWFDYERGCFRSFAIGSRVVGGDPHLAFELAEHFRFVHLALAAYRVSGESRYLEWAERYGTVWTRRIAAVEGRFPLLWTQRGEPRFEEQVAGQPIAAVAGAGHHVPGDPLAGLENLLASGAVHALGDLYAATGDDRFRTAARSLAAPLVAELADPCADPAAAAICHYRHTCGDRSLDDAIRAQFGCFAPPSPRPLAMVFPQEHARDVPGVGRRNDMIHWAEWHADGSTTPTREPSTAALTLAYQVTGDAGYAARALDTAARKLAMARRVLRGGREHADMGGAVCSVAAGHGRNWGTGAVTGCYGPLLLGTCDRMGAVTPRIDLSDRPAGLLSLVSDDTVLLYNGSANAIACRWRPAGAGQWQDLRLAGGTAATASLPPWMEGFGALSDLAHEHCRVLATIDAQFERIDPDEIT